MGGPLLAVISDRLWQRIFSRDPNVLGRSVNFGNQPYTIIGVMPPQMFSPRTVEVWFPVMRRTDNPAWQTRDNHPGLFGWGRLKKGVTQETALNELKQIAARLAKQYPDSNSAVERDRDPAAGESSGRLPRQPHSVARRGRARPAHRVRKSGQPARGARRGAGARVRGPRRGGSVALANHSPAPDRESRSGPGRRCAGTLSGGVGPRSSGRAFARGCSAFSRSAFGWLGSFVQSRAFVRHQSSLWSLAGVAYLARRYSTRSEIRRAWKLRCARRTPFARSARDRRKWRSRSSS